MEEGLSFGNSFGSLRLVGWMQREVLPASHYSPPEETEEIEERPEEEGKITEEKYE